MSGLERIRSEALQAPVERRKEHRHSSNLRFSPVTFELVVGEHRVPLEVINCHHRGASLRAAVGDLRFRQPDARLAMRIGTSGGADPVGFRVVWETVARDGAFGVEFLRPRVRRLARPDRFTTHAINTPVVRSSDPLDPNRTVFFKAVNASSAGMLLSTSLTNKHIFPGMELKAATIEICGIGSAQFDLVIENSRTGPDHTVLYGVSVVDAGAPAYRELIAKYLCALGEGEGARRDRLARLVGAGLMSKQLKSAVSIREVETEEDYVEVLKLRFEGYGKAGKVRDDAGFRDMGEGLAREGVILAGYLGGELVASVELRFSARHVLRISGPVDMSAHPYLARTPFVEVNKLVVSPKAQRSDIVVGMFQKIHALTVLNGKPDALCVAEDELVPLYARLGATKIGVQYPHPIKPNTTLHVMCIPRATYEHAININPVAWAGVFAQTQDFMARAGLADKKVFTLRERLVIIATQAWLRIRRKRRARRNPVAAEASAPHPSPETNGPAPAHDPRWTLQHIHTNVLRPYLQVADEMIGTMRVNAILCQCGVDRGYFSSSGNWLSIAFFDRFIVEFANHGDVRELQERAGYRNVSKEVLGIYYFILKHFLTPRVAFRSLGAYIPKFNKTRTYEIVDVSSTHCRIRVGAVARHLLPQDASSELNWKAVLDGVVRALTGRPGNVEQVASIYDGDTYSEYVVRWSNPWLAFRGAVAASCVAIAAIVLGYRAVPAAVSGPALVVLAGAIVFFACGAAARFYFEHKRKYDGLVTALADFQRDSDERYRELQASKVLIEKSCQESVLLEQISREIQESDDLTYILNNALRALSTRFDLGRAFAMTLNEPGTFLHTTAMFGAGAAADDLWKFKVDVSRRAGNHMLLSSVYHSGQSILVTDVEEHKFHLNDASRRLVERLRTRGFAIVPIPSERKNWGVLVADKGQAAGVIAQRDLATIQRVAQSIGLALDKKARIETERHLRAVFQKYAPSAVIAGALGATAPRLGGQRREVICLFLDVRHFTSLSERLPPEILCELLNELFEIVQHNVVQATGILDKFLGDGCLVTWGAVPGSHADPLRVLDTARGILADLAHMNARIGEQGMAPLEVGIGIHTGPVVAGNIGTPDRMEFSVIGSTVNVASRLEQLTKVYGSQIVISECLVPFDSLAPDWTIHTDVAIRGLNRPIRVATMSLPAFHMTPTETI